MLFSIPLQTRSFQPLGFLSVGKALSFKHLHCLGFRLLEASSGRGPPRPTFLLFDLLHFSLHESFLK
jgi:hypothetical protein